MFLDRGKIITPVILRFCPLVFFQNFVFERHGIEEFRLHELHVFQGISVLKPLMFQKKQIVNNDVCSFCSYTGLGVCVCVCVCGCTRESGIHRSL